jgi:hypothetical protein
MRRSSSSWATAASIRDRCTVSRRNSVHKSRTNDAGDGPVDRQASRTPDSGRLTTCDTDRRSRPSCAGDRFVGVRPRRSGSRGECFRATASSACSMTFTPSRNSPKTCSYEPKQSSSRTPPPHSATTPQPLTTDCRYRAASALTSRSRVGDCAPSLPLGPAASRLMYTRPFGPRRGRTTAGSSRSHREPLPTSVKPSTTGSRGRR